LQDKACWCLHIIPEQNKETFCIDACDYPKGALCGGGPYKNANYISIYKKGTPFYLNMI